MFSIDLQSVRRVADLDLVVWRPGQVAEVLKVQA
jgi:hypothetical protein